MSITLFNKAWEIEGISPIEKLVLLSLADRASDSDGSCYPGMKDQIRRTCASDSSIRRAIRKLEKAGHISVQPRVGTSSIYTVHPYHGERSPLVAVTTPEGSQCEVSPITLTKDPSHGDTLTITNPQEPPSSNQQANLHGCEEAREVLRVRDDLSDDDNLDRLAGALFRRQEVASVDCYVFVRRVLAEAGDPYGLAEFCEQRLAEQLGPDELKAAELKIASLPRDNIVPLRPAGGRDA